MTTSLDSTRAAGDAVVAEVAMEEDEDIKPSVQQIVDQISSSISQQPESDEQQQQQQDQQPQLEDDNNNSSSNNNINNNNTSADNNNSYNNINDSSTTSSGSSSSNNMNRLMKIKKLRAKLVNEEHRLVLMKKIRQSQTRPISQQQQQSSSGVTNLTNNNNLATNALPAGPNNLSTHGGTGSMNNTNNISFNTSAAGQLKKPIRQSQLPSSSLTNSALHLQNKNSHHHSSSSLSSVAAAYALNNANSNNSLNQTPAHAHQRPKVNTLWNPPQQGRHPTPAGIAPPHVGNLSRQPITTPPNVVQAMMGSLTSPQSLLMNSIANAQQTSSRRGGVQQPQLSASSNQRIQSSSQMLLQKRNPSSASSNFKPSLQKQLEQTLLQQQQQLQQRDQQNKYIQGLNFPPNLSSKKGSGGGASGSSITSPHVGNLSRQPITTPPNVVQDMRASLSGGSSSSQQSLLMNANNLSASSLARQSQSQHQSPFNKSQATQLLIQRRNAAKSAIQKQLEQNLMQLPQKQIQLAIDFIPNANNIEFVYYIGLEACVDYLTNTKNPLDIEPLEKPLECSTCGTDFTPSWSWKRSNAVCEVCVSNHVKKSIKNSQANRIKSALAKAVKQESEMDQKIMAEAANVVSSPTGSPATNTSQHSLLQQPITQHQRHTPQRSNNNSLNNWSRSNHQSPMTATTTATSTSGAHNNIRISNSNVQPAVPPNPLGALQPAALLSLLQMNPQLNALASLMNPTQAPVSTQATAQTNPSAALPQLNNNNNNSNNTNQFAQVAALLMNQLTTNLWRR